VAESIDDEGLVTARLVEAQTRAVDLFDEVRSRRLISPGVCEVEASDAIRDLAATMFGTENHWQKRIVRAGPNTLQPYREDPPDRVIGTDDIVFCDFGPIFGDWESDLGRTFVIGDDPIKLRLCESLAPVWDAGRAFFDCHPDITGEQLFAHVGEVSEEAGWEFGGTIAGHLIGQFPHEKIDGDKIEYYVTPGSTKPMRRSDRSGRACHWILEVHLVDRGRQIGGFYEQLLDLGPGAAA